MVRLAEAEQPGLTIVGPELPLSLGIVDALQERGLRVFGPTRAAAMLETSKGFAKQFLQRHNIPTGNYAVCSTAAELEKADRLLSSAHRGQGRRAGRRQGRDHLHLAAHRHRSRPGTVHRRAAGRGGAAGGDRGVPRGRRDQLPLPERRQACGAAGSGPGPQAHRRGRHRPQHRRHGRLLDRRDARCRHDGVDSAPHCRAHGSRHGRGRRRPSPACSTAG